MTDPVAALEVALGHRFADRTLLEAALAHASLERGQSNERLEFLGDRVLGLAIAAALYARHAGEAEGDLARRLNALVRREACADRALVLGIDKALKLGASEAQGGGRKKVAILADACEAVLAAVYLDAGYDAAAAVVMRTWQPLLDGAEGPRADPKTELQETLQSRGEAPPTYRVVARTGPDHAPRFSVEVVGATGTLATGEGGSKREAEQAAASTALATLMEQA